MKMNLGYFECVVMIDS